MNFTEYLDSFQSSLYEEKEKTPKCKKGYKWDAKIGGCVPVGAKKKDDGKKENTVGSSDGYGVWGSNGRDGGYALAEPDPDYTNKNTSLNGVAEVYTYSDRERAADDKKEKEYKARDKRMKEGNPRYAEKATPLRKGEFKRFDKKQNKWVSNMGEGVDRPLEKGEMRWFDKRIQEWVSEIVEGKKELPVDKMLNKALDKDLKAEKEKDLGKKDKLENQARMLKMKAHGPFKPYKDRHSGK